MTGNVRVIGRCSVCGGRVVLPTNWLGIHPPLAYCEQCGATERSRLPVIPMDPIPKTPKEPNPWTEWWNNQYYKYICRKKD